MGKVLIIDDEKQILGLLSRIIGLEGYEVLQAATCKAGLRQMEQHSPEVVLCDVFLPDGNGVDLVSDLKKLRPLSEIILLTAHGNIPDGVQAIKNGAFDYITKGDDNNKIIPLVAKAMEKASAAYQQQKKEATFVGRQYSFDTIVGKSPAIQAAIALAQKVSATEVPVLVRPVREKRSLLNPSINIVPGKGSLLSLSIVPLLVGIYWKARCSVIKRGLLPVL